MKRIRVIMVLLVTLIMLTENVSWTFGAEQEVARAEVSVHKTYARLSIACPNLEKATMVITYDPEVLSLPSPQLFEGCHWRYDISKPGEITLSFNKMMPTDFDDLCPYATVDFKIVGCGKGDVQSEYMRVYANGKEMYIQPTVVGENENVTVHDISFDSETGTLNVLEKKKFSVTTAKDLDAYKNTAKRIVLGDGIKELTCGCFKEFATVEEVVIPSSVTSISQDAFQLQQNNKEFHIVGDTLSYAEVYATERGVKFVPSNEQLLGDVDGSGAYEASDALSILKMVMNLEPAYGYSADVNEDGQISVEDSLAVLRQVVKLK